MIQYALILSAVVFGTVMAFMAVLVAYPYLIGFAIAVVLLKTFKEEMT